MAKKSRNMGGANSSRAPRPAITPSTRKATTMSGAPAAARVCSAQAPKAPIALPSQFARGSLRVKVNWNMAHTTPKKMG